MVSNLTYFLLATIAGFGVDLLYAQYVLGVAAKRAALASACSVGIGACGVIGITSIVTNGMPALVGYLLGLGLGTFVGVRYG